MNVEPLMEADIPIPDRETYIPRWGTRHGDRSLPVTKDGEPCGFTIGQVLPERRWAVKPDGELMDQLSFERDYAKWISNVCAPNGQVIPLASVNKNYTQTLEHIPDVFSFVAVKLDSNGKLIPIDYDPDRPAPAVKKRFYTHEGVLVSEADLARARARTDSDKEKVSQMMLLQKLHAEGKLTAEDLASAVTGLLVGGVPNEGPGELPETKVPEGFSPMPDEEPEPEVFAAPCGREFPKQGSLTMHMRFCEDCKAQEEEGAA